MDEDILPDITNIYADPPIGGLRAWPVIRVTHDDNNYSKIKLANLHACLRKVIKAQNYTTLRNNNTIYITTLRTAREAGAAHNIHGYSTTPYQARRDSPEAACGSMCTDLAEDLAPHPHV
jgi:hypothetical protein